MQDRTPGCFRFSEQGLRFAILSNPADVTFVKLAAGLVPIANRRSALKIDG